MAGSVNRVVLVGTISKYGVDVRYAQNGSPCASFVMVLTEVAQDGKEYTTLVPCEIWGKRAEAAGEVEAGQVVVFEGKLRKRQKADQLWELVATGFELTPIVTGVGTGG